MNNWKIHFRWTIALGALLLIGVITFWIGGKGNEIVSYIGFASALISIILAVVAIFYSVVQNTSSQQNIGEMKSLVTQASVLITQKAEEISNYSKMIEKSAIYLSQQTPSAKPMEIPFDFYASSCSNFGILSIYSLAKSYEAGKPFSILQISEILATPDWPSFNHFLYSFGVLIGFTCFLKPGSVLLDLTEQKVSFLPPGLKDYVLTDINRRIKDTATEPMFQNFLRDGVQKIDALFAKP